MFRLSTRRRGPTLPALAFVLGPMFGVAAAAGEAPAMPEEVEYCQMCHEDVGETLVFGDGTELVLDLDFGAFMTSAHGGELICTDCHASYDDMEVHPSGASYPSHRSFVLASHEVCRDCHFDTYTRTRESIHSELLDLGLDDAPVCTDCHGAHSIAEPRRKEAMMWRSCARCHADVVETYGDSVHGRSLHEGHETDVPVCVDCHTAHSIRDPGTPGFHLASPEICISCHGDEERMRPYGIPVDVATTYLADFHGVTARFAAGSEVDERQLVVTCVDCHGVHDIASPALLPSGAMEERVRETCASCHEDASEDFSEAWLSHYRPSWRHAPLVFLVQLFYDIFIPFIVVGLSLQVGLHLSRQTRQR